ncbi:hypothetical protein ACFSSA_11165 [Luteolibacter algae]|uniref:Lipoprotein n=1 Tax=Luteolibacter algae TaxID=454151 RepID=A0ABW5D8K4_9BACT
MKNIISFILIGAIGLSAVSCTTSYDAYGQPRQTVDPGAATVGIAAAGILGYALAKDKNRDKHHHYNNHHNHYNHYDRYNRRHYRRY